MAIEAISIGCYELLYDVKLLKVYEDFVILYLQVHQGHQRFLRLIHRLRCVC